MLKRRMFFGKVSTFKEGEVVVAHGLDGRAEAHFRRLTGQDLPGALSVPKENQ